MTYVIDASVALKWFVTEEGSDEAVALREKQISGEVDFAAPDLLLYEVAHVLAAKKRFDVSEAQDAIGCVLDLVADVVAPDRALMDGSIGLARRFGLSVYDACYAALAGQQNALLVTDDRQLLLAARDAAVRVSLLGTL